MGALDREPRGGVLDDVAYYLGPHATQALANVGELVRYLTPAGDIESYTKSTQQAADDARQGQLLKALLDAGYGATALAGLAAPGALPAPRPGAPVARPLRTPADARGAMVASNFAPDVVSGTRSPPLARTTEHIGWEAPRSPADWRPEAKWVPPGAMPPRGPMADPRALQEVAGAFTQEPPSLMQLMLNRLGIKRR